MRLINNIILKYISYLKQLLLPEFFFKSVLKRNSCILSYLSTSVSHLGECLCLCSHWHIFNMCVSEREALFPPNLPYPLVLLKPCFCHVLCISVIIRAATSWYPKCQLKRILDSPETSLSSACEDRKGHGLIGCLSTPGKQRHAWTFASPSLCHSLPCFLNKWARRARRIWGRPPELPVQAQSRRRLTKEELITADLCQNVSWCNQIRTRGDPTETISIINPAKCQHGTCLVQYTHNLWFSTAHSSGHQLLVQKFVSDCTELLFFGNFLSFWHHHHKRTRVQTPK